MYLCYVDESGDPGMSGSPVDRYILTAVVVHELRWLSTLDQIAVFRKFLKEKYGLKLREELHSYEFLNKPGKLVRIPKSVRLHILGETLRFVGSLEDISIFHVSISKAGKPADFDVFETGWKYLLQRFHNGVEKQTFAGPHNASEFGIVIPDHTDEPKLKALQRKLRRYNTIPSRFGGYMDKPLKLLIEDPVHRASVHSQFIQLADVAGYFLKQSYAPMQYVRKKGARNWIDRIDLVRYKPVTTKNQRAVVEG
jgi:hypothetical protein